MTVQTSVFNRYRYVGPMIVAFLLSACAAVSNDGPVRLYTGAKKPDSEVVRLIIPGELKVEKLDGKKVETPYVPGGNYELQLLPGDHRIRIFYEEFWGDLTSGAMEKSDIFNFNLAAAAGSTYVFKHDGPKDVTNVDIGKSAKYIKIWVKHQDSGQTTHAASKIESGIVADMMRKAAGTAKQGEVVGQDGTPVATANVTSPATEPAQTLAKGTAASTAMAEKIVSEQDALDRLKFWWKMADEKQRKAFQAWTWGSNANSK